MPSLVEVLVGCYVAVGASAFAAVRMHYANRVYLHVPRWRKACETALFVIGPVIGGFVVGVLAAPTASRWPGSALLAYALLGLVILFAGWHIAERLHNRYVRRMMTQAAPLPIARAVTLPPREPDPTGVWCTACAAPHPVPFSERWYACPAQRAAQERAA